MTRIRSISVIAALAVIFTFSGLTLHAQDATALAPKDTAVFIKVDRLRDHRVAMQDDPFVKFLSGRAEWQELEAVKIIEQRMGMPLPEVFDVYFGTELVVIAEQLGPSIIVPIDGEKDEDGNQKTQRMTQRELREQVQNMTPEERSAFWQSRRDGGYEEERPNAIVFSRITRGDMDLLKDKLDLRPGEKAGAFETYRLFTEPSAEELEDALLEAEEQPAAEAPAEGVAAEEPKFRGHVAYNGEWIAFAAPEHEIYMGKILRNAGVGESLEDDDDYLDRTFDLPPDRMATAFFRDRKDLHALGVVRTNRSLVMHYNGTSEFANSMFQQMGSASKLDFGPLPRQTVGAYSVNFSLPELMGEGRPQITGFLDQFFAPKSLDKDILPNLGAPTIVFVGEIPRDQLDPDPGFPIPAIGMAFKLKNKEVGEDIDLAMQNIMGLANLATVAAQLDPIEIRKVSHAGAILHTANLGPLLAKQTRKPEMEQMLNLSYGQIRDWYFVCTHDMFFKHSILAQSGDFGAIKRTVPLGDGTPMARAFVRPQGMADLLKHAGENPILKGMFEINFEGAEFLTQFSEVWAGYEYLDATFQRRSDDVVVGRAELIRKDTENE